MGRLNAATAGWDRFSGLGIAALTLGAAVVGGVAASAGSQKLAALALVAAAGAFAVVVLPKPSPAAVLSILFAYQFVRRPLAAHLEGFGPLHTVVNQASDLMLAGLVVWWIYRRFVLRGAGMSVFLAPALGIAIAGLASSYLNDVPVTVALTGLWLQVKFWLLVAVAVTFPWRPGELQRWMPLIFGFAVMAALIGLLDFAAHGAVADALGTKSAAANIAGATDRTNAAQSVFGSANEYSLAMSLMAAITMARAAAAPTRRDIGMALLFIVAALVSLRLRAVLSVGAAAAIIAAVYLVRGNRNAIALVCIGIVGAFVVWSVEGSIIRQQTHRYTSSDTTARAQLYRVSGQIAKDEFPLGVGLGRFGSQPSADPYSPVYAHYGLSRIWGLSPDYPHFIADTSWPTVLGETGVAGLAISLMGFGTLFFVAFAALRRARGPSAWAPVSAIAVGVVILVDSSGGPTLFTWSASTAVALCFALTANPRAVEAAAPAPSRAAAARRGRRPVARPRPVTT